MPYVGLVAVVAGVGLSVGETDRWGGVNSWLVCPLSCHGDHVGLHGR